MSEIISDFEEAFDLEKNKILSAILAVLAVSCALGYQYFKGTKTNYFDAVTETYQAVAEIQSDLSVVAGNLSTTDLGTVETFTRKLNSAKKILLDKDKNFKKIDVLEEFADDNKKLLESLKSEYNLMNRWKEALSISNEYEASENFTKSKDLMLDLKEKSALLSVEGNYFEEIFDLAVVYEKVEKYLNAKKQLRYDRDMKEQAEREKVAAAEKAKQQAAAESAIREELRRNDPLGYNWIQDKNTGVFMQNPTPLDGESISWTGSWVWSGNYKMAHGYGTTTWIRYGKVIQVDEGNFFKGRKNGEFKHKFFPSGRIEYRYYDNGVMIQ